jgi:Zn-finger domain-containing protein
LKSAKKQAELRKIKKEISAHKRALGALEARRAELESPALRTVLRLHPY